MGPGTSVCSDWAFGAELVVVFLCLSTGLRTGIPRSGEWIVAGGYQMFLYYVVLLWPTDGLIICLGVKEEGSSTTTTRGPNARQLSR
jgi:hypothetical protein